MKVKTFSWVALAFVVAAAVGAQACGPDKPPLTPDALDIDAAAVPDMPAPKPSVTAVPPG